MRKIQSKKQKLGIYEINKKSLSSFDDGKSVLNDAILVFIKTQIYTNDIDSYNKNDFHKKKRFSQMITNKNKCLRINS